MAQQPWPPPATYPGAPVQPYAAPMWEHPRGTTVLVLGILSLMVGVTAPFAWYLGHRAEREIAAGGVPCRNGSDIRIGKIIGMVMTFVTAAGVLAVVAYLVFFVVFMAALFSGLPR